MKLLLKSVLKPFNANAKNVRVSAHNSRSSALKTRSLLGMMAAIALVTGVGVSRLLGPRSAHATATRVYTSEGLGGYIDLPSGKTAAGTSASTGKSDLSAPLRELHTLYRTGEWTTLEAKAATLWEQGQFSSNNELRMQAAQAHLLAGYAAAWRKDYVTAGERFRATQLLAGELPDHGAPAPVLGEAQATLEEEASFQHAVCTGAMGHKQKAEGEYDQFLQQYPHSILIHAAVKRITRLNGGNIPASADTLWKQAMAQQKAADLQKRRDAALCGPECLAELLRRQGKRAEVTALANEMQTSADGTTLANLAHVTKLHGFTAQGVGLTQKGLAKQKLPLIALLRPGHYVLVEAVKAESVTVWDPDANGTGQSGHKSYTLAQWQPLWTGMALTVK